MLAAPAPATPGLARYLGDSLFLLLLLVEALRSNLYPGESRDPRPPVVTSFAIAQ